MGSREPSTTRAATAMLAAPAAVDDWRDRLRVALYALYRQFTERPAPPVEEEIEALVDLIDGGRAEPAAPPTLTRITAEALGRAIFHELFLASRQHLLPLESELVPMLMYSAVLPYAGVVCADEELRIPPPPR
jgi:hypothetical protein